MTIKSEYCDTCYYAIFIDTTSPGSIIECRRYPPVRIKDWESVYPRIKCSGWCGEWKKVKVKK